MKLEPHLPQLPSVGELLEHPRVKGLVARINRSTLAHRAAGFVEELRASLTQRSGKVEIPSVTQLAERLARRLLGEPAAGGPVINATGVVVGHPELSPPLMDAATHAMMQVAGEYHDRGATVRNGLRTELCRLTGAEAALVVSSFAAAIEIVVASLAGGREMLVVDVQHAVGSPPWAKIAARHGTVLHTVNESAEQLAAYEQGGNRLAVVLRSPAAAIQSATPEVLATAKKLGAAVIDAAPQAGLLEPTAFGLQGLDSLKARVEKGADVVIADGSGLLGGPPCGLVVGKRQLIEQAASHHLAALTAIDPMPAAALGATLAAYGGDAEPSFTIPLWQQLSAPIANLQQRAERIAALLSGPGATVSAEALETESPWCGLDPASFVTKTWVVAVRSRTTDAAGVLAELRRQSYPIVARVHEEVVHLDLRSVFPRWDQQLVAAFEHRGDGVRSG